MSSTFGYAILACLTAVFGAPLVLMLFACIVHETTFSLGFFIAVVVVGGIYSVPGWLLLWYAAARVSAFGWSERRKKALLSGIGVVLTGLSCWVFGFLRGGDTYVTVGVYTGFLCLGLWLFPLDYEKSQQLSAAPLEQPSDFI